jgi:hypothetical protein
MVDMPMPAGGPPRAIIDASDKSSPAATIERRLSTCVMWKILGGQAAWSQNEIRVRCCDCCHVLGRTPAFVCRVPIPALGGHLDHAASRARAA